MKFQNKQPAAILRELRIELDSILRLERRFEMLKSGHALTNQRVAEHAAWLDDEHVSLRKLTPTRPPTLADLAAITVGLIVRSLKLARDRRSINLTSKALTKLSNDFEASKRRCDALKAQLPEGYLSDAPFPGYYWIREARHQQRIARLLGLIFPLKNRETVWELPISDIIRDFQELLAQQPVRIKRAWLYLRLAFRVALTWLEANRVSIFAGVLRVVRPLIRFIVGR